MDYSRREVGVHHERTLWQQRVGMAGETAKSSHHEVQGSKSQRPGELGRVQDFETSKPTPTDIFPLVRTYLLNPPKKYHHLGASYSNTRAHGEHSHSNHHVGLKCYCGFNV